MPDLFHYTFFDNKSDHTLFLFHGTGGSEEDFLFLNHALTHSYNIVALRGNVQENGMNRFFRRLSPGVFDQESIKEESEKLSQFLTNWYKGHGTDKSNSVFLGYSNGANFLLAMLFLYPELLQNLVLLHPMLPFTPDGKPLELSKKKVFVSYGKYDQMIQEEERKKVIELLSSHKAQLTEKKYPSGHEIIPEEINDVITFLTSHKNNT